jgi:hypothetical protein
MEKLKRSATPEYHKKVGVNPNVYLIDWKQKMPLFWNGKIKPQYLISSTLE